MTFSYITQNKEKTKSILRCRVGELDRELWVSGCCDGDGSQLQAPGWRWRWIVDSLYQRPHSQLLACNQAGKEKVAASSIFQCLCILISLQLLWFLQLCNLRMQNKVQSGHLFSNLKEASGYQFLSDFVKLFKTKPEAARSKVLVDLFCSSCFKFPSSSPFPGSFCPAACQCTVVAFDIGFIAPCVLLLLHLLWFHNEKCPNVSMLHCLNSILY